MPISEQDVFGEVGVEAPVTLTAPGTTKPVHLRYPSFEEWHEILFLHKGITAGSLPDAKAIARTVAICLADPEGNPLKGDVYGSVMKWSPRRVSWVYGQCWDTVLKNDNDTIKEVEKN